MALPPNELEGTFEVDPMEVRIDEQLEVYHYRANNNLKRAVAYWMDLRNWCARNGCGRPELNAAKIRRRQRNADV